jgi:AcrR family transcriptional regulator
MNNPAIKPTKGEATRASILDAAVRLAALEGFGALTIGTLAEKAGMSKSGLFAHFGSKDELQVATLDEAVRRYNDIAFLPALKVPRGLRRLRALANNWLSWVEASALHSCPMMSAMNEFDGRPGVMQEAITEHMQRLNNEIMRGVQMTIASGEFKADTDCEQFAFEMFGIVATSYRSRNLFQDKRALLLANKALDRLINSCLVAD